MLDTYGLVDIGGLRDRIRIHRGPLVRNGAGSEPRTGIGTPRHPILRRSWICEVIDIGLDIAEDF